MQAKNSCANVHWYQLLQTARCYQTAGLLAIALDCIVRLRHKLQKPSKGAAYQRLKDSLFFAETTSMCWVSVCFVTRWT